MSRATLLLVERNVDVIQELLQLLQAEGYPVAAAASVSAAMSLMAATRFEMLLIGPDVSLPDMRKLANELRRRNAKSGTTVIVYGAEGVHAREALLQQGATHVVPKAEPDKVIEEVRTVAA